MTTSNIIEYENFRFETTRQKVIREGSLRGKGTFLLYMHSFIISYFLRTYNQEKYGGQQTLRMIMLQPLYLFVIIINIIFLNNVFKL